MEMTLIIVEVSLWYFARGEGQVVSLIIGKYEEPCSFYVKISFEIHPVTTFCIKQRLSEL